MPIRSALIVIERVMREDAMQIGSAAVSGMLLQTENLCATGSEVLRGAPMMRQTVVVLT